MPEHFEQATAAPNDYRKVSDREPDAGLVFSASRLAFLRKQCEAQGHQLAEAGEQLATCTHCGAQFTLTEW